ncbi:MAG: signal recognition particle protein [Actinobacteria bacterium]|nr:signal recognition particle protein [Actinomycetota bacterium]
MMFDSLSFKLQNVFSKLKGRGKLGEKDVEEAMREVRLALLEADVNYKVVKDFVAKVKERSVGKEVLESLTPAQQVIKIVNEELTNLMGSTQSRLILSPQPPSILMMVGLQGSGKTTTTAKLARYLKKEGRKPFLVAADIYRPAAIHQLELLGGELQVPVFKMEHKSPSLIAEKGIEEAISTGCDAVIIDTAGRLHIDEEMMNEVGEIKKKVKPHQILLVVDAMTGQDAVNVAVAFEEKIGIDGIILTKLDGDARGGAALSIKSVTGKPIKFVSMGEKIDNLEVFHPDRMSSRILGMGDVLSLIEKAEKEMDLKKAQAMETKLKTQEFTLEDFLDQMQEIKKLGPINQIISMLPGVPGMGKIKDFNLDEKALGRIQAIIQSMTKEERRNPAIVNGNRRQRIAKGSGVTVHEVNQLLKQFEQTKKLLKQFGSSGFRGKMGKKMFPFFG